MLTGGYEKCGENRQLKLTVVGETGSKCFKEFSLSSVDSVKYLFVVMM